MARRSDLVRMRIATVLNETNGWMTCNEITERFLDEGWSFTSAYQLGRLCSNTIGITSRIDNNGNRYYKIENLTSFHHWMKQEPVYGN